MSKDTKGKPDSDAGQTLVELTGEAAQLLAQHRPGEAVPLLIKARELDPGNAAAAINLGGAYILQGKHKQAAPVLEDAVPARARQRDGLDQPGSGLSRQAAVCDDRDAGQSDRRIQVRARLDPRAPHVNYNLGLIYLERQDVEQAALHFYAALETDPNDRDAARWLAKIRSGEVGKTPPAED